MVLRTLFESSSAFEPGAWKIGMATAGLLLSRLRSAYSLAPELEPRDIGQARDRAVVARP